MIKYFLIAIISGIMSSFSQVLLKISTKRQNNTILNEYFNPYVIGGYSIMVFCMIMTVIAYKGIPFKYGAVLESLVYFYIMILSKLFLNEKLTKKKIIGNMIIILGVIIFGFGK